MRKKNRKVKVRSDQELIEEIERNQDATEGWDSGPIRATVRRGSTVVFSLRLSADELEVLRDRAVTRNMTVSDVIREAVFSNAISVSFSTAPNVVGTGVVVSTAGISAGSIVGGTASSSGLCNAGPYSQFQTDWCYNMSTSSPQVEASLTNASLNIPAGITLTNGYYTTENIPYQLPLETLTPQELRKELSN
jgi:hypothetical protein